MSCTQQKMPMRFVIRRVMHGVLLFLLVGAAVCSAQIFTVLHTFDGTDGANPTFIFLVQGLDGQLYGTTYGGGAHNFGTVFKVTTGGTFTPLYSFCAQPACADGNLPAAGLALAPSGFLYGTTVNGGAANDGTAYKISSSGTFTSLASVNVIGGNQPYVGLILATNGGFYGTTSGGGNGVGTIYSMTSAGMLGLVHALINADGNFPDGRLVQGNNGIFYGTAYQSGSGGVGTVYEVTAGGKLTTLHNFSGPDGNGPHGPLFQGADGLFYGGTVSGGANSGGNIYKISPTGKFAFAPVYSFCALASCADGSSPYEGVIQATDGNFYGTTRTGGANGSGTIFKLTPAGVLTTLYSFCSQPACADGANPDSGLVQATDGNFYGVTNGGGNSATSGAGTVFKLSTGLKPFVHAVTSQGKVGAKIVLLGTNLTGTTAVSFNGTPATFTVVSKAEITATIPANASTGSITVTTPGGVVTSDKKFRVTPQFTSFTPPGGPVGTVVTITGVSLAQTSKITFGGIAATTFTVNSDTQVTVTVPTGAVTGKIVITTSGGTASSATSFTVM